MPALALILGDDERPVAARPVGDEDLAAVDDELVAEAAGCGRDAGDVRSGIRLGDGQGGDLLAADRRHEPALLLLLGPELEHRRGGHLGLDGNRHPEPAAADLGHLLGQHDR